MVDKGPRLGLVLYDKFKPWQRLRVDGCVNPRPLARRLPESVMPETVATFWSSRMHMPGKVIHSQNNQYGKRTRPQSFA
nr:hypothetical protein BaRGS_002005 [Batillaria attramentaria]